MTKEYHRVGHPHETLESIFSLCCLVFFLGIVATAITWASLNDEINESMGYALLFCIFGFIISGIGVLAT